MDMKKNWLEIAIRVVVSALTALLTARGVSSCM